MDNIYILKEIAKFDKKVWKLFSLLNKEMNDYFNVLGKEYELNFNEIKIDGSGTYYLLDGKFHRSDGPAAMYNTGSEEWYFNGKLHRLDGPAKIIINYYSHWYKNGLPHRLDGPAVEYVKECNKKYNQWFVDGKLVVKEDEYS